MRITRIGTTAIAALLSLPLLSGCVRAHEVYGQGGHYYTPQPYVYHQPPVFAPRYYGSSGRGHDDRGYRDRDRGHERHARKDHQNDRDDHDRSRHRDRDRDGDRERHDRRSFEQRHPTPESLGIRPGDGQVWMRGVSGNYPTSR